MSIEASNAARAVILAAGKSAKFFPPLYDKPKGLFTFRGEVLIERQIRQLQEAGISDITVVIGYEKECFFYLEEKFGVKLLVSTRYNDESNLSSLHVAREQLGGSYLCAADHWYDENPFTGPVPTRATRLVQRKDDAHQEFVAQIEDDGRITSLVSGAASGSCLAGYAYFTPEFAERLMELYEQERDWIGVKAMHWEQFWNRHAADPQLALFAREAPAGFKEFDSLQDLQQLDARVLDNVSKVALDNICRLLECERDEIRQIEPLNKGLTNVSFSFYVRGERYVYRHPGASSSNMVNRDAEVAAQELACELGIDSSVMFIGREGWKLSHYVDATRDFDYSDDALLARGIEQIKRFHAAGAACDYEVNLLSEGERLLELACNKKGDLFARYEELHADLVRVWHYAELDAVPRVLCHNDTYAVNWIVSEDGLDLIDWEYAGMNDPVNDICTLIARDELDDEATERVMRHFFGGKPSFEQRRHTYAYLALCGWYWFCWSVFKDTLAEDGFFMLPSWRALNKYLPIALDMYKNPDTYKQDE